MNIEREIQDIRQRLDEIELERREPSTYRNKKISDPNYVPRTLEWLHSWLRRRMQNGQPCGTLRHAISVIEQQDILIKRLRETFEN